MLCDLGEGSFGKVKLCVSSEDKRAYALKILNKGRMQRTKTSAGTARCRGSL